MLHKEKLGSLKENSFKENVYSLFSHVTKNIRKI